MDIPSNAVAAPAESPRKTLKRGSAGISQKVLCKKPKILANFSNERQPRRRFRLIATAEWTASSQSSQEHGSNSKFVVHSPLAASSKEKISFLIIVTKSKLKIYFTILLSVENKTEKLILIIKGASTNELNWVQIFKGTFRTNQSSIY